MTRHLAASYGTLVVLRKTKEKHIERTARKSRKENIIFFRLIEAQLVHVIPAAEPMLLRPARRSDQRLTYFFIQAPL